MNQNMSINEGFAVRLALFYGAVFLVVGIYMPYFPLWLALKSLNSEEIGIVLAAPLFVRVLFTPAISFIADSIGNHRRVLILLSWGTLGSLIVLMQCETFWQIFFVSLVFSLFWTTVMPLTETVAMTGVRRAGLDYGRMRLWGSMTFILASFGGGFVLDHFGVPASIWMLMIAGLLCVVTSHLLPKPKGLGRLKVATSAPQIRLQDVLILARSPIFLLFLLASSTTQAAHAVFYGFGTLHWKSQGLSAEVIGALWTVGVLAEIILFAFSRDVLARVDPPKLILLGAFAALIRWTATALDPPVALLFPLQLLHALTFGATHLGAIHFIANTVPESYAATAQGIYSSFSIGIVMGSATALAGWLYTDFGSFAYFAMSGLAVVSALASIVLIRYSTGKIEL